MKKRIAILGGGMGALATAYELTQREGHRDRFEITVYQMGHRLGGKGASGVDLRRGARIEEHGLHLLWGFYDNVFRMMRECYAELGRPRGAQLATWEDATIPCDNFVVPERTADGWDFWTIEAPRHEGFPGDPTPRFDPPAALRAVLRAARSLIVGVHVDEPKPASIVPAVIDRALRAALPDLRARLRTLVSDARDGLDERSATAFEARLRELLRGAASGLLQGSRAVQDASLALLDLDLAALVVEAVPGDEREARADRGAVAWLLRRAAAHVLTLAEVGREDHRRRVLLDLALSVARGMIVDDLVTGPRNWFRIDDEDFRAWLRRHGAREETAQSAFVEGIYAAGFAKTEAGAGTLLHGAMRLAFSFHGALLYRMRAGMGETVFAPLHDVLSARGVRFEFFHVVDHLELSADRKQVARIVLDRQAKSAGEHYEPLVDVDGLRCWPTEPLFDQLVGGAELRASGEDLESWWNAAPPAERVVLEAGRDFDAVVLGIALGALPELCRELIDDEQNPRFAAMVRNVATTETQAAQLWFRPGTDQLGWTGAPVPIVVPYEPPFDAWADMSHLLVRERGGAEVTSLAYLTGTLADDGPAPPRGPSDYPLRRRALVRENLARWLGQSAGGLWPEAASRHDPAEINWAWLADPEHRKGPSRLDAQYWCATKNPSDRYVLSLPGTNRHRLRADESGYDNLFLAGDWTRTSMSGGCLEGAAMGGIQAARAIDPGAREALGDWLEAFERPADPRPGTAPFVPVVPAPRSADSAVSTRAVSLPRYVPRDGELLALPPIGLDIEMYTFVVPLDVGRIAAMCDAELNLGGETRYRPLAPFAVLYFARVDNYPVGEPMGWVPEIDVGIWVPLAAGQVRAGRFAPERVVLYTPYIWVDHPLALTIGRAVYGFKKELADITMPATSADPPHFAVDTWVIPRFGARSRVEKRRIAEVRRVASGPWERMKTHVQGGRQMLGGLLDVVSAQRVEGGEPWRGTLDFARRMLDDGRRGVRMVYLKQLPDAADVGRACYQAVIEADVAFTGPVEAAALGDPFEIEMTTFDSHHIAETLGLRADRRDGRSARIRPAAAAWTKFQACIGPGTIVWEAGRRGFGEGR